MLSKHCITTKNTSPPTFIILDQKKNSLPPPLDHAAFCLRVVALILSHASQHILLLLNIPHQGSLGAQKRAIEKMLLFVLFILFIIFTIFIILITLSLEKK